MFNRVVNAKLLIVSSLLCREESMARADLAEIEAAPDNGDLAHRLVLNAQMATYADATSTIDALRVKYLCEEPKSDGYALLMARRAIKAYLKSAEGKATKDVRAHDPLSGEVSDAVGHGMGKARLEALSDVRKYLRGEGLL